MSLQRAGHQVTALGGAQLQPPTATPPKTCGPLKVCVGWGGQVRGQTFHVLQTYLHSPLNSEHLGFTHMGKPKSLPPAICEKRFAAPLASNWGQMWSGTCWPF